MSVRLDCGCPALLVESGAPHNLNCNTRMVREGQVIGLVHDSAEGTIDHAFKPYMAGSLALEDVCCECGDYHDQRRDTAGIERRAAEKLLERVEQKMQSRHGGKIVMHKGYPPESKALLPSSSDPNAFEGGAVDPEAALKVDLRAATGVSLEAVRGVAEAAKCLKAAELALRAAQQGYADAVTRLSDEAVK